MTYEVNGAVEFRMPGYLYNVSATITEIQELGVMARTGDAVVYVAHQDILRYYTPLEWRTQAFENGSVKSHG